VQTDPKTRVVIELTLPRLWIVADFRLDQTLEAGPFCRDYVRIDYRLENSFCAQERGRAQRQDVRSAATLGFVV